jgi:rubrerythrin
MEFVEHQLSGAAHGDDIFEPVTDLSRPEEPVQVALQAIIPLAEDADTFNEDSGLSELNASHSPRDYDELEENHAVELSNIPLPTPPKRSNRERKVVRLADQIYDEPEWYAAIYGRNKASPKKTPSPKKVNKKKVEDDIPEATDVEAQASIQKKNVGGVEDCKVCFEQFSCAADVQKHVRDLHYSKGSEKPFSCPSCSAAFRRISHLHRHILIHTGQKAYMCNICQKSFARNDHLTNHMWTHAEGPYSCQFCSFEGENKFTLRDHVVSEHSWRKRSLKFEVSNDIN